MGTHPIFESDFDCLTEVKMVMDDPLIACTEEWKYLSEEYSKTKDLRTNHQTKSIEFYHIQQKCKAEMERNAKKLRNLKRDLAGIAKSKHDEEVLALKSKINEQLQEIQEVETRLPGNNGFYLRLIVGDLNLTLPTSELKRKYKENYEKWKLWCTLWILAFSVFNLVFHHRFTDALHSFLLLWFYCTLTVRESILIVNGSRIRGWWVAHHYISAFLVGIHILWPADAQGYDKFRAKFVLFSLTVSLVQVAARRLYSLDMLLYLTWYRSCSTRTSPASY